MVGGIQTGKTTRMMEYAKEHGCMVLTFNQIRACELRDKYDYKDVYRFFEMKGSLYGKKYVIDDLEICINHYFYQRPEIVTMTAQLMHLTVDRPDPYLYCKFRKDGEVEVEEC